MHARTIGIPALFLFILIANSSIAGERTKREKVIEYFDAYRVTEAVRQQVSSVAAESKKIYLGYSSEFWDHHDALFEKYEADLLNAYIDVAEQSLSDDELDLLLEFLRTELGQKFVSISHRLQPLYGEAAADLYSPFMAELAALVQEYAP